MAYTIISQNNSTTTLADENGNVITVPARVTLATSTDYSIIKVNNNSVDLQDGDGKIIRGVPACVVLAGEGGGGGSEIPDQTGHSGEFLTTDGSVLGWAKTEQVQREVLPQADENEANKIYEYVGATDATYTNGYFYKCVGTTTYTGSVTFQPATLSSSTIACSGDDFAAFVAEWGSGDITTITSGTLTYDQSGGLLVFVGKDAEDTTVCTFQLYTEDYQDAGFTITGTLQDGDVFAFVTSITATTSYAWTRVDVQPTPVVPSTTPTLLAASWSSNTQTITVTGVTSSNVVLVSPAPSSAQDYADAGIICTAQGTDSLTFTCDTVPSNDIDLSIVIL